MNTKLSSTPIGFRLLCGVAFALVAIAAAAAQIRGVAATLTPVVERASATRGKTVRAALQVSLPDGFHVQSDQPRDPTLIPTVLTVSAPKGVTLTEIVFPTPVELKQIGIDQPLTVFEREFPIGVQFTLARTLAPGELTIPLHLRYQACNDTTCFPPKTADAEWRLRVVSSNAAGARQQPELFDRIAFGRGRAPAGATAVPAEDLPGLINPRNAADTAARGASLDDFAVAATTGGYLGTKDFLKFVHDAENGVKQRGLFEGRGPLAILLIVFLGGIALNLTPCVLPMVPINLAIIGAGAKAGSRSRGFLLGAAYGGAMALVYGVLGLVVILTAGTFGTINSSPWFNLAIALLFVVLGLAMFDVITIDFSRFSRRRNVAASGSLLLAFGMGAIAALLAGACVAPVVIQVVLFSSDLYARGTTVALALPFFLGIGMAIPWPIAGAGLAALPKPGAWMVCVKEVLGVVILATAAYYAFETYSIFANRWVDPAAVASSVQEKLKEGWYPSLDAGLAAAKRDRKPVLVDMWATWCKNCLTMDVTTMKDPGVVAALNGYVKIKFQAEDPERDPAKEVMRRFDAIGLPTYVILRPK